MHIKNLAYIYFAIIRELYKLLMCPLPNLAFLFFWCFENPFGKIQDKGQAWIIISFIVDNSLHLSTLHNYVKLLNNLRNIFESWIYRWISPGGTFPRARISSRLSSKLRYSDKINGSIIFNLPFIKLFTVQYNCILKQGPAKPSVKITSSQALFHNTDWGHCKTSQWLTLRLQSNLLNPNVDSLNIQ